MNTASCDLLLIEGGSHLAFSALFSLFLLFLAFGFDLHISTELHVVFHVESGFTIFIHVFIPHFEVILLIGEGPDEIFQSDGIVDTLAVKPETVDSLFADLVAVGELVVVHRETTNLGHCHEAELTT